MMVVGPSQSGKTTFVLSLIHERKALFDQSPNRIVWCCAMKQAAPQNRGFVIIEGLPQLTDIRAYDLVVLDDLMMESFKSEDVTALFTRAVHHPNFPYSKSISAEQRGKDAPFKYPLPGAV